MYKGSSVLPHSRQVETSNTNTVSSSSPVVRYTLVSLTRDSRR